VAEERGVGAALLDPQARQAVLAGGDRAWIEVRAPNTLGVLGRIPPGTPADV
jgi:hypothetical protein